MTLRLNPRVTGTDRSCGHVQGTARTLFDSLGSTPYESQACRPSSARPTWPDRAVRRLLAWLLALSAWHAGEPQVRRCFRLRHGQLRLVWWPSEGVGARGGAPEKLIKMATGQRRRHLRLEAAVPAARCSIALLSRRPSLSRFPSCLRRCSQGFSPSAMSAVAGPDSSANREERGQLRRELRRRQCGQRHNPPREVNVNVHQPPHRRDGSPYHGIAGDPFPRRRRARSGCAAPSLGCAGRTRTPSTAVTHSSLSPTCLVTRRPALSRSSVRASRR
jgi:hypothetical protein